jgi:4-hydroxy-2-oxoheptanedioate aldolase
LFGVWVTQPSTIIVETVARCGSDFVVLDLQHSLLDFRFAAAAIQLLDVLGIESFVRIPFPEIAYLPRLFDFGLHGAIVANVVNEDQVAHAVSLARYQPLGSRSYGGQRFGLRAEPAMVRTIQPKVCAMIETLGAVQTLEGIASTPGLAGLMAGPGDLSLALGLEIREWATSPVAAEVMERVRTGARTRGLEAWAWTGGGDQAAEWAARGYDRVSVGSDVSHLRLALQSELAIARGQRLQVDSAVGGSEATDTL